MKRSAIGSMVAGAAVANEAVLLWRAFEPASECGRDAQTHNELSPQHHREYT